MDDFLNICRNFLQYILDYYGIAIEKIDNANINV